jgi:hypothetical protein
MAKKQTTSTPAKAALDMNPMVAAALTGVIYQARLLNRQSKLNIPEAEVVSDVVGLWRTLMAELGRK